MCGSNINIIEVFSVSDAVANQCPRSSGAANGDREIFIFLVQLTMRSRIGNLTRLIHTLAIWVTIHVRTG